MGKSLYESAKLVLEGAPPIPQEPMHSVAKDEPEMDKQGEQDLGSRIDTPRGKAGTGPALAGKGVSGRAPKRPADQDDIEEPMHSIPDDEEDSEGPAKFPKRPADANSKQAPMQRLGDEFTSKGKGPKNVDEAEVNELSKRTLGNYVKKASDDIADNNFERGNRIGRGENLDTLRLNKLRKKYHNRDIGIHRAVDRLTKEDEIDEAEVNEISKSTLNSYLQGRGDDVEFAHKTIRHAAARKGTPAEHPSDKDVVKANKKFIKRSNDYMSMAVGKLNGLRRVNATDEAEVTEDEEDIEANDKKVQDQVKYESVDETEGFNIADYVNVDEDMDALFNGENLSEEFREKAKTIYEAAVTMRVNAIQAQLTEAFEEILSEEIENIQNVVSENVDDHLNYVVEQWALENEVALEAGLRTELTEDFITGLRNLFIENYIDVPEEEMSIVEELASKVESLEDRLNEEIGNNVALNKALNEQAKETTFLALTRNLTEVQADKLHSLVEGVDFVNEDDFATKVETIYENYYPSKTGAKPNLNEVGTTDSEILAEDIANPVKVQNSPMARYVNALSKTAIK